MRMAAYLPEFCGIRKCNGFWNNGLWNCYGCNIVNGYTCPGCYDNMDASYYGNSWYGPGCGDYYNNWAGCLKVIYDNIRSSSMENSDTNVIILL